MLQILVLVLVLGLCRDVWAGPASDPDQSELQWRKDLLQSIQNLVQVQTQVLQQLGILGNQVSLLVENHQALLLQTSRIATNLQEMIVLQISVNGVAVQDQSELSLRSGSALSVHCHGDGPVQLRSSAFRLLHVSLGDGVTVTRTNPRHTGTYSCSAPANQSAASATATPPAPPSAAVHLYVSGRGRSLPQGMTFTFDPWRGALVHRVQRSFEGSYVCRGRRHGQEVTSAPMELWASGALESELQSHSQTGVLKNRTLVLDSVQTQDSGLFTCSAGNEAGVSTATTRLEVKERPFVSVSLQIQNDSSLIADVSHDNATGGGAPVAVGGVSRVEVLEGRDLSLALQFQAYPPIRTQRWVTPGHVTNSSLSTQELRPQEHRAELRLLIGRVHRSDSGLYSVIFSNDFFTGNVSIELKVHYPPLAQVLRLDSGLVCRGSGFPVPSLVWTSCPDSPTAERPLTLSPGDDITVVCSAVNHMGQSHDLLQLREPASLLNPLLIGSFCVVLVLLLLLVVAVWKWKQKPRFEIRWKIIDTFDGNSYTFVDPTQLPYDLRWEFPRERLRLGAVLGSGAFGKVVAATAVGLDPDQNETTVAVKMLKPRALSEEREALMSELKILSHIGFHHNIVNLLGACTTGGPMLMITEYCRHGDLLNFLRARARHFLCDQEAFYKNIKLHPTNERPRSDSGISCGSDYQEMKTLGARPGSGPGSGPGPGADVLMFCSFLFFRRSFSVADGPHEVLSGGGSGLDFLSSKNERAAHRTLRRQICDFGLARDIRNDDSYIVKGNARLPVKWMSPESIFLCVYTTQSDVWSYGVLLWEIYSMGRSPYPNMAVDSNFYRRIKDGVHMERPDFAPVEMFDLMKRCWDLEPTRRPTFNTIGQIISGFLPRPIRSLRALSHSIQTSRTEETKTTRPATRPTTRPTTSPNNSPETSPAARP
ncbi:hypothetical protein WMY93_032840 [Mugilogobius chulae]|uniref:receptor protein-tyrosine kinase n=1 Tax=Mugilogobius chulae TaxID=88201 RepID=A0AAW0MUH7_9GOBI